MSVSQFGDNTIDNYIERLSKLNQERPQVISQKELESLALQVGIAPEVLERAHNIAQSSFEAGLRHQAAQNWDAAIAAFEQSVSLQPCDPESLYQLAVTHHSRYRATRNSADAKRAEALVRECLSHAPHHAAATELRAAIQVPLAPQSPPAQTETPSGSPKQSLPAHTETSSPKKFFIGTVAVLGGGFLLLFAVMSEMGLDFSQTAVSVEAETRTDTITQSPDREPGSRSDLPIEVADSLTSLGINISLRQSRLNIHQSGEGYHSLDALLVNDGTRELRELELTFVFKDRNDAVLEEHDFPAVGRLDPTLRPGDSTPISRTRKIDPRTATVEASLKSLDSVPGATTYDPGRPIPVSWDIPQPSHLALEAIQRDLRITASTSGDEAFVRGTFALTNTGEAVFESLVLEFRAYNAADALLDSRQLFIVGAGTRTSDLWQTETRLTTTVLRLPKDHFHRYELVVIQAR